MLIMFPFYVLYVVLTYYVAETSGQCPEGYFTCDSGIRCVSSDGICDGVVDCLDRTDESCQGGATAKEMDATASAVVAANYLVHQMAPEHDWDNFLPRNAIALSFLGQRSPLSEPEKKTMIMKLNNQLIYKLRKGLKNLKLHELALYINAFYSLCEDPRAFYKDNDLVSVLRVEADRASLKGNFNLPVVILSLCLAKEVRFDELNQLIRIYDTNSRIGTKALSLIVMAACQRQGTADHHNQMKKRMEDFVTRFQNQKNIGAYSKALILQAYNAWSLEGTSTIKAELLALQSQDGSFHDLLGTYAAIPALLNTSLADLQCKTREYKAKLAKTATSVAVFAQTRCIVYGLQIPYGQKNNVGNYSLRLYFNGRKSLFQLMKQAEDLNQIYRFTFDEVEGSGKKLNSLANISNDPESGLTWMLYRRITEQTDNSMKDILELGDIDYLYPEDGDHYIYKLEYSQ